MMFGGKNLNRNIFRIRIIGYFGGVALLMILVMWGDYSLLNRGSYDIGLDYVKPTLL